MIPRIYLLLNVLTLINYFSIGFLILLSMQIFFYHEYYLIELELILWIYYMESTIILGILSFKFFSWSLSTASIKRSYLTWLYGISISVLALNSLFTVLYVTMSLQTFSDVIIPHGSENISFIDNANIIKIGFQITSILAYVTFWIATIILLYKYSSKIGKIKYWVLIALPLLYYLIPFYPGLLSWLNTFRLLDPVLFAITYTIFFSNSIPIGGLLFGLSFWSIGNMTSSKYVKDYMYISGYGVVLFFAFNQAILLSSAPFPPISIAYISIIGFASYLILVGIFSSSISYSQDVILRKKIQKAIEKEFIFLNLIGKPELEKQLLKKITLISVNLANDLEKDTGIKSSIEEEDMQNYISEIMNELKNTSNEKK
jgi:hypothetical protein